MYFSTYFKIPGPGDLKEKIPGGAAALNEQDAAAGSKEKIAATFYTKNVTKNSIKKSSLRESSLKEDFSEVLEVRH